jgi:hypothetical protein
MEFEITRIHLRHNLSDLELKIDPKGMMKNKTMKDVWKIMEAWGELIKTLT